MSNKQRHEYELKFKVGSDKKVIPGIRQKFKAAGFVPGARSIETDYLPDTPDDGCKNAKILLRFRRVDGSGSRKLLLTLKVKQADQGILHVLEYEVDLSSPDSAILATINDILRKKVGLELDETITHASTLEEVKDAAHVLGFTKHRILLSKYRENFSSGKDNTTIDYFPDGMGVYVEFESHSRDDLHSSIKRAGFDVAMSTVADYGDLLKLHKAGLKDQAQRTALFDESEQTVLKDMMERNHE